MHTNACRSVIVEMFVAAITLSLLAFAGGASGQSASSAYGKWGVDLSARDASVRPGDDFWNYANGAWARANPIPADKIAWGIYSVLHRDTENELRNIIERSTSARDPINRQIADMYISYMDEKGIEARGLTPARVYLDRIDAVRNKDDLIRLFGSKTYPSPLDIRLGAAPTDPAHYSVLVGEAGLGMPDRSYYLNDDDRYRHIRAAYRDYVAGLLEQAGEKESAAKADGVIKLEKAIAEVHWTGERNRDVSQLFNSFSRAKLAALAPDINWPLLLDQLGVGAPSSVIVYQPSAVAAESRLLATTPIGIWKAWMTFHFLNDYADFLPKRFDDAHFDFFSRTLAGTEQQSPRWRRGLALVNDTLGEAVGKIYADRHFTDKNRQKALEMVGDLKAAMAERIRTRPWMDDATKEEALVKLTLLDARIGRPARFIDYSSIQLNRANILSNVVNAGNFDWNLQVKRLAQPVDKSLWGMTPQTINAYFNSTADQVTFPAAYIQPPFFDADADPAVNYGSLGSTIGHEISHGFDDQGRRFDATGRLRDWWSQGSSRNFTDLTNRLSEQYSSYVAVPGTNVNGRLTLGENIADLGGLEVAYTAYQRYIARHGPAPILDGLTGDQRFFLAYAQLWRTQIRPDVLRGAMSTDPHSPPLWRVNGVLRNMDPWYRAFGIKPDDRLYLAPEQRVHIW
jgi:putative endopeptidase